jgi:threonine-phosphate decarboxylase
LTTVYTHGGDVERAAREAGIAPECILDFSANINPMGLPPRARERLARDAADPNAWARYPDPELRELRSAISQYVEVARECIVIGGGADSLIHCTVRAFAPRRCVLPIPAFSEYERAWRAAGCGPSGDLCILNNPHNPTGACEPRSAMLQRIREARDSGASVLVDEAFVDYIPEASITRDAVEENGVVAIRSLTKFFGCPGLRVGYAVASPETAALLKAQLPPWPVTILAAGALAEALRDVDYRRETLERNARARACLAAALAALGCHVCPCAANFLLVRLPAVLPASELYDRLLHAHGILVRKCDSFSGLERDRYLRIAVRDESDNARLLAAFEGSL